MAVAAAQQAAALRAAESRAQAAMMVEAVEDRAYEVISSLQNLVSSAWHVLVQCVRRAEVDLSAVSYSALRVHISVTYTSIAYTHSCRVCRL